MYIVHSSVQVSWSFKRRKPQIRWRMLQAKREVSSAEWQIHHELCGSRERTSYSEAGKPYTELRHTDVESRNLLEAIRSCICAHGERTAGT